MKQIRVVPDVALKCRICDDDEGYLDPGVLVFLDGYGEAELICRLCWTIIRVSSAAKLNEVQASGESVAKWTAEALEAQWARQKVQSAHPENLN